MQTFGITKGRDMFYGLVNHGKKNGENNFMKFKKPTPNMFHFYTEKLRQVRILKTSDSALHMDE